MKRTASQELAQGGTLKKLDVGSGGDKGGIGPTASSGGEVSDPVSAAGGGELEHLVREWADGNDERVGRWIKALNEQDIENLQALRDLSTDDENWERVRSNVGEKQPMLATKLKLWKESQPISPVEAMQIDGDGKSTRSLHTLPFCVSSKLTIV
jgi:hypothetical protein